MKVQYFCFYLDGFDASEFDTFLDAEAVSDYDYALVEDCSDEDREFYTFAVKVYSCGKWGMWSNQYFEFMPSGRHSYEEYPHFKRFAK